MHAHYHIHAFIRPKFAPVLPGTAISRTQADMTVIMLLQVDCQLYVCERLNSVGVMQ